MFGNVGLRDRLTFSAFGAAVNEVQRLQVLTKKFSREVVASQAFAGYSGGEWVTLGEEKLRGVRQKLTVLHPKATIKAPKQEEILHHASDGLSEAEQVILLHRDARKQDVRPQFGRFVQ
jgi:adenylate cyclase